MLCCYHASHQVQQQLCPPHHFPLCCVFVRRLGLPKDKQPAMNSLSAGRPMQLGCRSSCLQLQQQVSVPAVRLAGPSLCRTRRQLQV